MRRALLEQAVRVVREAAHRRDDEKQAQAIERAAAFLGVSGAIAYKLYYSKPDACTTDTAQNIIAQRSSVLVDRLEYENRRHQTETARLIAEYKAATETECSNKPASALRRLFCASLSGSAVSPGEWQSADIEPDFAWDYGL